MNEFNILSKPYKIIYKVKNKNNKYQYYTYIFVGDISKSLVDIINKFQNISLSNTLEKLNTKEYKELSEFYKTDLWFKYFFNKYHVNEFLKSKEIKKFEEKFKIKFPKHNISLRHKFTYGYTVNRKLTIHEKIVKKDYIDIFNDISSKSLFKEIDEEDIKKDIEDVLIGGKDDKEEEEEIEESFDSFVKKDDKDIDEMEFVEDENKNEVEEVLIDPDDQQKDNETLENELKNENKNIKEVKKIFDNTNKILKSIDFDNSKDNNLYNEELKNHFTKNYIFNSFIKYSDTIQDIKEKIFFTIKNNKNYGTYNYLEPSRIYLWSEYFYNDKYYLYSIGKEIIENNNLLDFPIEPLNIDNYINPDLTNKDQSFLKKISKIYNIQINNKIQTLLYEHSKYIENNEIYMIDIYNEIGTLVSSVINETQKENLYKFFCFLYFEQVNFNSLDDILNYITYSNPNNLSNVDQSKRQKEQDFIKLNFDLLYSNYILKNWLDKTLFSTIKKNYNDINKLVSNYCITRIQIHVELHNNNTEINNIDTHTIFNEMEANNKYLFIQYTKLNGTTLYKFNEKELKDYINRIFKGAVQSNLDQVIKWFNISQPGIIFKYQFSENKRPLHIYIDNFGRLNFDIYASCDNSFKYEHLEEYKKIIRDIIVDINKTGINYPFLLPEDNDYTIKFINCIKDVKLPDKINYNDLSDLYAIYYPYFSNIVEPKRKKDDDNFYGKSGIYLRYKRISNYNSKEKIQKTIKKYRKYYDNTEKEIVKQISKEFNLLEEDAQKLFNENVKIFPYIKQVKQLKRVTNKTHIKYEGISVELQHKENGYVIKYHGLRNKEQDEEVTIYFLTILFIYLQIYIYKNKEYFYIKDKIKEITNIAKRKFEILNFIEQSETLTGVKEVQSKDTSRLKFKAKQNKSVWSRLCQNSGKLHRQPKVFSNIDDLIKFGYKMNKSTGYYERQVTDKKGNKITLKAVNLSNLDSKDSSSTVYYTCNPEINGNQMYIGLLNKLNPDGKALPCCFINDKLEKQIAKYKTKTQNIKQNNDIYNLNYILINNRYVPLNRLKFLPTTLNYFLNTVQNKKYKENNHVLKFTDPEYYFIVGTNEELKINNFLSTIAHSLDIDIQNIFKKIEKKLDDKIFNSLNNGMIKIIYKTKEKYLKKIKNYSENKDNMKTEDIAHVLTIPGIIFDDGLNIIIIQENKNSAINKDFFINYVNKEEIDLIDDKNRKNIALFFNGFEYSIISRVYKHEEDIEPTYKKNFDGKDELINHIKEFYKMDNDILKKFYNQLIAKKMYEILKNKKIKILNQIINSLFKTVFFTIEINKEKLSIPTVPSGSIYNVDIKDLEDTIIVNYETFKQNIKIYEDLKLSHVGFYYYKIKNDQYYVKEIMLSNGSYKIPLPIKKLKLNIKDKNKELLYFYKQYYKNIDDVIKKYPSVEYIQDDRVKYMEYEKYKDICYQYFRYGISKYLFKNQELKQKIIDIVNSKPENIKEIRRLIYSLIENQQLHKFYKEMTKENIDNDKKISKFTIRIFNKNELEQKIKNYDFNKINQIKFDTKKCQNIIFSLNKDNKCVFTITFDLLVDFINKICYELINNGIKGNEILNLNNYFVSPVIDTNIYKLKDGQKILRKNTEDKKNIFVNYLKENPDNVKDFDPNDDEKYQEYFKLSYKFKKNEEKMKETIENNIGKLIKSFIYQPVFSSDSYLRAYCNCLFWLINEKIKNNNQYSIKNMGYYSIEQDRIINYVKSQIIDYLLSTKFNEIDKVKVKNDKLIQKISRSSNDLKYKEILKINTYLLNIFKYKIFIINQYNLIMYVTFKIEDKEKYDNLINTNIENIIDLVKNSIIIKINDFNSNNMESVYLIVN